MIRRGIVIGVWLLLLAAAGGPATAPSTIVKIENFSFQPRQLTIAAGTTVTWENGDDIPHTATADGDTPLFDSGPLDTDEKYSFTFLHPGKYPYYCKVHPHMTGIIVVN
jgi:plastocyanin